MSASFVKRDCGLLADEWDQRAPRHLTNKGNQRVRAGRALKLGFRKSQQEYLLHVSLAHEPGFRLKKTLFKHYPQLSVLALFFSSFLHPFPPPPFSPLDLFLSKICAGGLVPNRHEVLIAVTRGSQMLEIIDGFACSFPSPFSPPLLVSPCEPAGFGELSALRAQRIPWQRSTLTDGRRTETDFGFGWSSGISRKFLRLVSHCILLFRSYLIRKGL